MMDEAKQTEVVRPGHDAVAKFQDIQLRLQLLDLAVRVTADKTHVDTLVAAKEFEVYVKGTAQ